MRYTLDIYEDDPDEAKAIGKAYKQWMRDVFSQWDDSILQYFMYENQVVQNAKGDRLALEGHLEKIVKDDCSSFIEQDDFNDALAEDLGVEDPVLDEGAEVPKDTSSSDVRVDEVVPSEGEPGFTVYREP